VDVWLWLPFLINNTPKGKAMTEWFELLTYNYNKPELENESTEDDSVLDHVLNCTADGFCYICQCL
jgi:hypothetical protein